MGQGQEVDLCLGLRASLGAPKYTTEQRIFIHAHYNAQVLFYGLDEYINNILSMFMIMHADYGLDEYILINLQI
jgi:hypothetical protein